MRNNPRGHFLQQLPLAAVLVLAGLACFMAGSSVVFLFLAGPTVTTSGEFWFRVTGFPLGLRDNCLFLVALVLLRESLARLGWSQRLGTAVTVIFGVAIMIRVLLGREYVTGVPGELVFYAGFTLIVLMLNEAGRNIILRRWHPPQGLWGSQDSAA